MTAMTESSRAVAMLSVTWRLLPGGTEAVMVSVPSLKSGNSEVGICLIRAREKMKITTTGSIALARWATHQVSAFV